MTSKPQAASAFLLWPVTEARGGWRAAGEARERAERAAGHLLPRPDPGPQPVREWGTSQGLSRFGICKRGSPARKLDFQDFPQHLGGSDVEGPHRTLTGLLSGDRQAVRIQQPPSLPRGPQTRGGGGGTPPAREGSALDAKDSAVRFPW